MRKISNQLLLALSILAMVFAISPKVKAASEEDIANAIDKGIDYLLARVKDKQFAGKADQKGYGLVALETYALLIAGVSVDHPLIDANFKKLSSMPMNHTYSVSCYAFALDAAISQIHADLQFAKGKTIPDSRAIGKKYRGMLEKCIRALINMKHKGKGRWNYGPDRAGKQWDNSNVQFAVLAIGLAPKRNIKIDPTVWEEIALHFIDGQQKDGPVVNERIELLPKAEREGSRRDKVTLKDKDEEKKKKKKEKDKKKKTGKTVVVKKETPEIGDEGIEVKSRGWSYRNDKGHGGYKWNMGCAGLSSLILAHANLKGRVPPDFQNKVNKAIRDGYGWMLKNWNINGGGGGWKYYGYYSLEKVGDLGYVKKFGKHDWYKELATAIVKEQKPDGSWPGNGDNKIRETCSFALLVLNRATSLLTQRANRMVITGPGAHRSDRSDHDSWVFIQSLNRELHIPSVMKVVRLRPSAKILKFVDLIVENYPPERIGYLVPRLTNIYNRVESPRTKKYILGLLATATGIKKAKTADQYADWAAKWTEIQKIGDSADKKAIPKLLEIYKTVGENPGLRERAIWAIGRVRASKAAPMLLEDLDHTDEKVRVAAYSSLMILPLSSKDIPEYDGSASTSKRRKQLKLIQDWFKDVRI